MGGIQYPHINDLTKAGLAVVRNARPQDIRITIICQYKGIPRRRTSRMVNLDTEWTLSVSDFHNIIQS